MPVGLKTSSQNKYSSLLLIYSNQANKRAFSSKAPPFTCMRWIIFINLYRCKEKKTEVPSMKPRSFITVFFLACLVCSMSSCSVWKSVFGPKYGCPANGKNTGAERVLSGEKVPKAPRFKA